MLWFEDSTSDDYLSSWATCRSLYGRTTVGDANDHSHRSMASANGKVSCKVSCISDFAHAAWVHITFKRGLREVHAYMTRVRSVCNNFSVRLRADEPTPASHCNQRRMMVCWLDAAFPPLTDRLADQSACACSCQSNASRGLRGAPNGDRLL